MGLFMPVIGGGLNPFAWPKVRRCRLEQVEPRVESAWFQRLKLSLDKLVSSCAFNVNLRRYTKAFSSGSGGDDKGRK